MSASKSFDEITIAKGIAIILVCVYHFSPTYAPEWWHTIIILLASLHMPLFMAVSGWLAVHTRKDNIDYAGRVASRFNRLMVPYLTVSVLIITMKLFGEQNMSVDNPVTVFAYVEMLYEPVAGYFLWFIWAVMLMFVITSVSFTRQWLLFMGVLSIILYFLPVDFPALFALKQFKAMFVFYMAGMLLREYAPTFDWLDKIPLLVIAPLFLFVDVLWVNEPDMNIVSGLIGIVFGLRISRLVLNYETPRKLCVTIGGASYTIYLFHTTFMGFAKSVVGRFGSDWGGAFPLVALCVIACGVMLPYLLDRYILHRWRLTRMLFLGARWCKTKPALSV